ncbi:CybS-domain-containing protein [Cyathus striatus]|nr:CybS-domain-containing protein [Cyathus striatus]
MLMFLVVVTVYKGTVNDPTTFPPPSRVHGSYHWSFERLLSAGLVPLTLAAFATSGSSYPVLDGLLGISLVIHSHIGFDSMIVDYLHPRKFPVGPATTWTLRLTELIARVWTA